MSWDLHIHSNNSDGTDSIEDIIKKAAAVGVNYISLTDHDCVDGVDQAVALGKEVGITVFPGVELSIEGGKEIHILGYNIDTAIIRPRLSELKEERFARAQRIIEKLNKEKVDITLEEVQYAESGIVGRLHIAKALVKKRYASDINDAFSKYLAVGAKAYEPRHSLTIKEAVELIKKAKGFSCLAHPVFVGEGIRNLVKELAEMGISAIEAYYPAQNDEKARFYEGLAKENGLYVTCGSDYHGSVRKNIKLGCEKRTSEYLEESKRELFLKNIL